MVVGGAAKTGSDAGLVVVVVCGGWHLLKLCEKLELTGSERGGGCRVPIFLSPSDVVPASCVGPGLWSRSRQTFRKGRGSKYFPVLTHHF